MPKPSLERALDRHGYHGAEVLQRYAETKAEHERLRRGNRTGKKRLKTHQDPIRKALRRREIWAGIIRSAIRYRHWPRHGGYHRMPEEPEESPWAGNEDLNLMLKRRF